MREKAPKNIKMTELSKIASNRWKNLSEDEKAIWKRRYEINRDRDLPSNTSSKNDNDKENFKKDIEAEEMDQDPPVKVEVE